MRFTQERCCAAFILNNAGASPRTPHRDCERLTGNYRALTGKRDVPLTPFSCICFRVCMFRCSLLMVAVAAVQVSADDVLYTRPSLPLSLPCGFACFLCLCLFLRLCPCLCPCLCFCPCLCLCLVPLPLSLSLLVPLPLLVVFVFAFVVALASVSAFALASAFAFAFAFVFALPLPLPLPLSLPLPLALPLPFPSCLGIRSAYRPVCASYSIRPGVLRDG